MLTDPGLMTDAARTDAEAGTLSAPFGEANGTRRDRSDWGSWTACEGPIDATSGETGATALEATDAAGATFDASETSGEAEAATLDASETAGETGAANAAIGIEGSPLSSTQNRWHMRTMYLRLWLT